MIEQKKSIPETETPSRLIAIDPGCVYSALVMWDGKRIISSMKEENAKIREYLNDHISIRTGTPVFCEMIASYGMPVGAEIFDTCLMIGNLQQITQDYNQPFYKIFRKDVKIHLCHSMKAKDSNIRQALIDRFGGPGVKKAPGITYGLSGDTWSAFAVAVYAWDTLNNPDMRIRSVVA